MTDRDRLIESLFTSDYFDYYEKHRCEQIADHLLANGVIVPPCKVGDYVLWNNGLKDSKTKLMEIKGFYYDSTDFGLRYILEIGQPIINHSGIEGIVPKEQAEQALKERERE